jgi:DNA-binding winged helix-turn-helix (wHTH) protein
MSGLGEDSAAAPRTSIPRVWSFAGCVLDERSLELKVQNQVADLDRKPLEVLIHLLRHAGEVVTKDELAEAVWPGRIITDSNLTKTMAVLRAALGDGEATVIKTVHGYGYRLMAPVSVQAIASEPAPARFDFKPGESPPLRPHWQLSSRLGAGGHGEVWLAHHSKTKEPRVFKFAEGGAALTALKREITLNRLLRETLPGRDDYLRLLDWNFDEPPFFVESEYAASGSLAAWAESQGGWSRIPLATRLDLLAQAAEALAAAHSVGVLHKDLKPTNILVVCHSERSEESGQIPRVARDDKNIRIKLADFGSGGVLDPGALEALGITAMGFTQAVRADDTTSGTPLYLAPEVIAGQPFTVQSDIYALGVMLYQLAAGDFRKPLAPGWEKDIADELLRGDIAQAAAGNPADRLGDAGLLAQRLRTLGQRREKRQQENTAQEELRIAREEAERARQKLQRARVTRAWVGALVAVLTAGLGLSFYQYRQAVSAREGAEAVVAFMSNDILRTGVPFQGRTRDLSLPVMLERASALVDERLSSQPGAVAKVRAALGLSYIYLGNVEAARAQLESASALLEKLEGRDGDNTLEALRLQAFTWIQGERREAGLALFREVRQKLEQRLKPNDFKLLEIRLNLAPFLADADAAVEMRDIIRLGKSVQNPKDYPAYYATIEEQTLSQLGSVLIRAGEFEQAEDVLRQGIETVSKRLGDTNYDTAATRISRSISLRALGRDSEAVAELQKASAIVDEWLGKDNVRSLSPLRDLALLWLGLGEVNEAQAAVAEARRRCAAMPDCPMGLSLTFREAQGAVYKQQGRARDALKIFAEVLAERQKKFGASPETLLSRISLANAQRETGDTQAAWRTLAAVPALDPSKDTEALRWALSRAQGLLWLREKQTDKARTALTESLRLSEAAFGTQHWRTRRARDELAHVAPGRAAR